LSWPVGAPVFNFESRVAHQVLGKKQRWNEQHQQDNASDHGLILNNNPSKLQDLFLILKNFLEV
jgi:hypothetical protein